MSSDINVWVGTGRLVKNIEVKNVNKSFLITGTIASNRSYKKGEEWVDSASFFDFRKFCNSEKQLDYYKSILTKGVKVVINGDFEQQTWDDNNGQKHSKVIINVDKIDPYILGKNGGVEQVQSGGVPSYSSDTGFKEDIPF